VAGAETLRPRIFGFRQEPADGLQGLGVGEGIGARRAADGPLVHQHDIVDGFHAVQSAVLAGPAFRIAQSAPGGLVKNLLRQGRLAGTGHAGEADEKPQRDAHVDRLEIVFSGAADGQPPAVFGLSAPRRHRDPTDAPQVLTGQRTVYAGSGSEIHHAAPVLPGLRSEVQDEVAFTDDLRIVFHHHHGVRQVPQALQDPHQPVVVARVKPDAGLVQHVEGVDQRGSQRRGQRHALHFSPRQGPGLAVQREVAQTDIL